MPHDLLAAPFLGQYLLLRPGSTDGVQLPRGHFGQLAQAAAAGGSYPPWLAGLARQTWPDHDGGSPRYLNSPSRGELVPALAHKLCLLMMIGPRTGGRREARWRSVNAPHRIALDRAGAVYRDGVLAEPSEPAAA